jgi:hypothetical protein
MDRQDRSNDHYSQTTPEIAVTPPAKEHTAFLEPSSSTMYSPNQRQQYLRSNTAASSSLSNLPLAHSQVSHDSNLYEMKDFEKGHDPQTPYSNAGPYDPFEPSHPRNFAQTFEDFDTSKASKDYLTFADGDVPKNNVRF